MNAKAWKHAGIVLAAGASSRMGRPKALLPAPGNVPLAKYQAQLLSRAGCDDVVIIIGCDAEKIHGALTGCRLVHNEAWATGRFSSAQAGLRVLPRFDGYFILPVDTVGVRVETLIAMKSHAERSQPPSLRPVFEDQPGRVAWISGKTAEDLLRMAPGVKDMRLDDVLKPIEVTMPVTDPAVANNINTPDDWKRAEELLRCRG